MVSWLDGWLPTVESTKKRMIKLADTYYGQTSAPAAKEANDGTELSHSIVP